jgi:triosephosphate isomerase
MSDRAVRRASTHDVGRGGQTGRAFLGILIGTSTKMNLTSSQAATYLDALRPLVADVADRELFVLLPFTSIWVGRERLANSNVRWGAQDVHPEEAGAHTGDVSAPMLADLGCSYVAVGHHERRRDHGETDELVAAKVEAIQRWAMTAILCVGEDRRAPLDAVLETIDAQVRLIASCDPHRLVMAYEPAWAIGEGATSAAPGWVGSVQAAIRAALPWSEPDVASIPIIYGGSVGPDSAGSLLGQPDVDGLFVGRKALDPRVFAAIAHARPDDGVVGRQ